MNHSIYPCLWFDGQAKEAAQFYCSVFSPSNIIADTPMVVQFEIEGQKIMGLNGGPMFKINPSISLFVTCETVEELDRYYHQLIEGGSALMPVDKYAWSERYAWAVDKFGMSWQLMLGQVKDPQQKVIPSFLFSGKQYGKAEQAIRHYTSLFPASQILELQTYGPGDTQQEGRLMFGRFTLSEKYFAAMDGPGDHAFEFNEAVSLVVECDTQAEIDLYWNNLTRNGEESMCGWLKDPYGVSWQIIPSVLGQLMTDNEKAPRVMQKLMKMRKLEIDELTNA